MAHASTDPVLAGIQELGARQSQTEKVVEGLMKALEAPASRAGVSPADLLHKMTNGGQTAGVVDPYGRFTPAVRSRSKGVGMGPMLRAIFKKASPASTMVSSEEADKTLKSLEESSDRWYAEAGVTKAALSESQSGATGGYLVPPQLAADLMRLEPEENVVRPRASIMPMTSLALSVPSLDMTSIAAAGNTNLFGGVVGSWVAEAATRPETEPTFRQTELKAWEASFYTVASNTMLADGAIQLDSFLTQLFGDVVPWFEDYAFIQGNGVGKPLGVLNAAATLSVNRANGSQISFADVAGMLAKLYRGPGAGKRKVCWVAHQTCIPQILQLTDKSGRAIFIPFSAGAQQGQGDGFMSFGELLGVPLIITEKMNALGTKGDLGLFDFSKYLIGDRAEIQIEASTQVNFLKNQTVWRVVKRVDGRPWLNSYVTLADAVSTVSPFVILN